MNDVGLIQGDLVMVIDLIVHIKKGTSKRVVEKKRRKRKKKKISKVTYNKRAYISL